MTRLICESDALTNFDQADGLKMRTCLPMTELKISICSSLHGLLFKACLCNDMTRLSDPYIVMVVHVVMNRSSAYADIK